MWRIATQCISRPCGRARNQSWNRKTSPTETGRAAWKTSGAISGSSRRRSGRITHKLHKFFCTVGNFVIRKALHEEPSVRLRADPVIEDCQNTAVRCGADQPPQSLLQSQNRIRDMVLRERISTAALNLRATRGDKGIRRHLERQFIDDDGAQ